MKLLLPFARRFVAGGSSVEAISAVKELNQLGYLASLDILGESVQDLNEAKTAGRDYIELIEQIAMARVRCNISLKLSQMGLYQDRELTLDIMRTILSTAKQHSMTVRIDMEGSDLTEKTLKVYWQLRDEGFDQVGIVLQAYLHRTREDIAELIRRGGSVRLCKGAYKEPPSKALQTMNEIRRSFIELSELLIEAIAQNKSVFPAFASHDDSIIKGLQDCINHHKIDAQTFEFQFLYGLRQKLALSLIDQGYQVRSYVPYGSHWLPYFYRRLRERKENVFFLLTNFFKN